MNYFTHQIQCFSTWLSGPDYEAKPGITRLQEMSLFCLFLTIPLFRLGGEVFGSTGLSFAKIFVGFTLLFWMLNILLHEGGEGIIRLLYQTGNTLLLLFSSIVLLSLINARYFQEETIAESSLFIKMLIIYLVVVAVVRDRRLLKITIIALVLSSILTTVIGLYELVTAKAFFSHSFRLGIVAQNQASGLISTVHGGTSRIQSLYSEPGLHSYSMVIFSGLAAPWIFYSTSRKVRISVLILLICYFINIIATGSRTGWISLVFAMAVFLFLLKHRYKTIIVVTAVVSMVAIFLILTLVPHLPTKERLNTEGNISLSWRLDTYRQALEMVRHHPLLGVGSGNYPTEYHNYLKDNPRLSRYFMGWIHNSYAQIWSENGTLGFIIFLLFYLHIYLGLLCVYLTTLDNEIRALSLGLISAFSGYAVQFSGLPLLRQELGWMMLALGVAMIYIYKQEQKVYFTAVRNWLHRVKKV